MDKIFIQHFEILFCRRFIFWCKEMFCFGDTEISKKGLTVVEADTYWG